MISLNLRSGTANGMHSCAQSKRCPGTTRLLVPALRQSTLRHSSRAAGVVRRAEGNEDQKIEELKQQLQERIPNSEKLPGEGKAKTEDKSLAIVTGAISIVIGVLYLAGVTLLNGSRGNHLEAPPPEAFGWMAGNLFQLLK